MIQGFWGLVFLGLLEGLRFRIALFLFLAGWAGGGSAYSGQRDEPLPPLLRCTRAVYGELQPPGQCR